jgi:hypothetical protein
LQAEDRAEPADEQHEQDGEQGERGEQGAREAAAVADRGCGAGGDRGGHAGRLPARSTRQPAGVRVSAIATV